MGRVVSEHEEVAEFDAHEDAARNLGPNGRQEQDAQYAGDGLRHIGCEKAETNCIAGSRIGVEHANQIGFCFGHVTISSVASKLQI